MLITQHRVARLNFMQVSVSLRLLARRSGWTQIRAARSPQATIPRPTEDSRGEVHVGSLAIRMASETGSHPRINPDDRTVIQLAQGNLTQAHLRRYEPGNAVEIDTPNLAFTLTGAWLDRIETDPTAIRLSLS